MAEDEFNCGIGVVGGGIPYQAVSGTRIETTVQSLPFSRNRERMGGHALKVPMFEE